MLSAGDRDFSVRHSQGLDRHVHRQGHVTCVLGGWTHHPQDVGQIGSDNILGPVLLFLAVQQNPPAKFLKC